jgi:small subunit ribosomal protein S6
MPFAPRQPGGVVIIAASMSEETRTYDLLLLLDPQADEAARKRVIAETSSAIQKRGELIRHDEWGLRQLSYPIRRHADAEYHLFQMKLADVAFIGALDRALRISDEVLRFMISKVRRGTPAPVKPAASFRREAEVEQAAA